MILINTEYISFTDNKNRSHRLNGPAYILDNYKAWYLNGKLHRIGGPAVINGDYQAWYIEGIEYNKSKCHNKLKEMATKKILKLQHFITLGWF